MINHLGDHRNLPLLFGIVTKNEPLQLVTQFHGNKGQSFTLSTATKKKKFDKPLRLRILKEICGRLKHVHIRQVLHNDLKSNNIVLDKRSELQCNPVIIDFGKARFIADPKPLMCLTESSQETYRKRYPYIAPEIVTGSGRQTILSDIYSLGKIALNVLDLLPTATAVSLKLAKRASLSKPEKRPSIEELIAGL